MEIKDLGTAVELGTEMADVRGGSHGRVGNIGISGVFSLNASSIRNGNVQANTLVNGSRSSGSSFSDIGAVVNYAPNNSVSQTSGVTFDITSQLQGLNFTF